MHVQYWLKLKFQVWSTKTEKQGIVYFIRILDPIRRIYWLHFMIGVKILKGRAAYLLKLNNIYLHLKDIFKKPFQCLDFCIRQLEFNIYNKTNYMHRKN